VIPGKRCGEWGRLRLAARDSLRTGQGYTPHRSDSWRSST